MNGMIERIYSGMLMVGCASLLLTFAACTDKDDDGGGEPGKPVVAIDDEVKLDVFNAHYDITIHGGEDWEVTAIPAWVTADTLAGKSGEPLKAFVESSDEEADRRDTITVSLKGGSQTKIPLVQTGTEKMDDNADAHELSNEEMSLTYGVGYGINVLTVGQMRRKYNIMAQSPFVPKKLIAALTTMGERSAFFEEPLAQSRYETITGSSTDAIASQLGVNAKIDVGIKAFKLSVEGGYQKNTQSDKRYVYAMQEIQHITASRYLRPGVLRYLLQHMDQKPEYRDVFQTIFKNRVADLQKDPTNKRALKRLVDTYGTHVIVRGVMGGELKVSMQMELTKETTESDIHAALDLSVKVINVSGKVQKNDLSTAVASNTRLGLQSYGGNNVYTIRPGQTFESFQEQVMDPKNLQEWVAGLKDEKNPSASLIDMECIPLYDLMPTQETSDALRNYIINDYQKSVIGDFKPDLWIVNGYDTENEKPGVGRVYIPEIDMQIEARRDVFPELSSTEYSTVFFSGKKDAVDYDHGFFVGSKTRRSCKLKYKTVEGTDKKECEIEEFERLSPGVIKELFVDIRGELTIATKSVRDLYQTCSLSWTNKELLDNFTEDLHISKDMVLTGKTNHAIYINGVTVTLDGVEIDNGYLYCSGNTTIVLADGTKNIVRRKETRHGACIEPAERGTTLTIKGNGRLEAYSGDEAAAIGEGKGNIVIESGTIIAQSDADAPGIGVTLHYEGMGDLTINGGYVEARCLSGCGTGIGATDAHSFSGMGNIYINGGTVYAQAPPESGWGNAAIGTGHFGRCHNIFISKNVTKVTAKTPYPTKIGAGREGTCGSVTIEEGANVVYE